MIEEKQRIWGAIGSSGPKRLVSWEGVLLAGGLNLEQPLDLRYEGPLGERLRQQGPGKLRVVLTKRGDKEQSGACRSRQLLGQLDAVHPWHDDIGHDQFNLGICRQSFERFDAVTRLQRPVPLARESTHHQSA